MFVGDSTWRWRWPRWRRRECPEGSARVRGYGPGSQSVSDCAAKPVGHAVWPGGRDEPGDGRGIAFTRVGGGAAGSKFSRGGKGRVWGGSGVNAEGEGGISEVKGQTRKRGVTEGSTEFEIRSPGALEGLGRVSR